MSNLIGKIGSRAGALVSITGTNPAAGAEASYTVPDGQLLNLKSFRVALVTSATVANRTPLLVVQDTASTVVWEVTTAITQAASITNTYTFVSGLGFTQAAVANNRLMIGIPDLWLPAGWKVTTSTLSIQGTDDYGAPILSGVLYQ